MNMFRELINEKVTLVKADGTIVREDIPAHVQPKLIFIDDITVPLEVGDHLLRKLSNGNVEDFIVDAPEFYAKIRNVPAHFQVKVRRSGGASPEHTVIHSITNNFEGANSRVNINSTDNSTNVVQEISADKIKEFLSEIHPVLGHMPDIKCEKIRRQLVILEEEANKEKPSQLKTRSALQTIRTVAEGATGNLVAIGIVGLITSIF
jgi:hypothetical protein